MPREVQAEAEEQVEPLHPDVGGSASSDPWPPHALLAPLEDF